MRTKLKISKGGQVSVPAQIRSRWRTRDVIAVDRGDELILKPDTDDQVARAKGSLAKYARGMPPIQDVIRNYKLEQIEAEDKKLQR